MFGQHGLIWISNLDKEDWCWTSGDCLQKTAGTRCLGHPKVNSDVVFYVAIVGRKPLLFKYGLGIKERVFASPFDSARQPESACACLAAARVLVYMYTCAHLSVASVC